MTAAALNYPLYKSMYMVQHNIPFEWSTSCRCNAVYYNIGISSLFIISIYNIYVHHFISNKVSEYIF